LAEADDPDIGLLDTLTGAERMVMKAICDCGDIREAAERLCLSPRTVQTHLHSIHEKLDVRSTMEAVLFFVRKGW
jgi:DNA-binding NarL/FixJ family response regulator